MAGEVDKALGRYAYPDAQDHQYLLMAAAPEVAAVPLEALPTYRYYWSPAANDQNGYPRCVGYRWRQFLYQAPVKIKAPELTADEIYTWAQQHDPWPGTDYAGTTVRAGVRCLVEYGHVTEYRWAFTVEDCLRWLLGGYGTLVVGTDWYAGMSRPDSRNYLHATGEMQGGHCYGFIGANRTERKLRVENNWGTEWADGGRAWMSFDTFADLLASGGEACCALERSAVA